MPYRFDSHEKKELIDIILEKEKRLKEVEEENTHLRNAKEKLEKELRKYKNPNTPPSAHPHLKPSVAPRSSGRRGAPRGHRGTTRPFSAAETIEHISTDHCPRCQSININVVGTQEQQLEDVPPVIAPMVRTIERDLCHCNTCHLRFSARDGKTPTRGRFGIHLIVLVLMLRFLVRGVLRKTATFLEASFAMKLAPATVQAIIQRAAEAGTAEYERLKAGIRLAPILFIDETSFSVLGKKWWVWVFRTPTEKLLVIRPSRGSSVIAEVLGETYAGIVHCDCWRAYDMLENATLQRCWAHLLRKSAELKETVIGRHFHEKLEAFFMEIVRFNAKEHTEQQRQKKYESMTTQMKELTLYYARCTDCLPVVKYIDFHIGSWFTCVAYAGVEPTNNLAEQSIRETVIVRKIIGAFRSVKGPHVYGTLASLIATWQIQNKDIRVELTRMLQQNLC